MKEEKIEINLAIIGGKRKNMLKSIVICLNIV